MKGNFFIAGLSSLALLGIGQPAHALAPETELLLKLLEAKGVISADDASEFKKELVRLTEEKAEGKGPQHYPGIDDLSERRQKFEETGEEVAEGATSPKEALLSTDSAGGTMTMGSALQKLHVAGGISAGEFYASNAGPDTSGNETLLSNFLFELSGGEDDQLLGFAAAVGETSTPSVLSPPDTTPDLDLEYASLSLKGYGETAVEVGLLKPDAGFEDTYTYNNANAVLGALASQQPYNAFGGKLQYAADNLNLNAAYYGKRLDDSEYAENGVAADHAWEVGIGTTFNDVSCRLYHYHIAGRRSLTGAVIEQSYKNISFALNVDWWQRDKTASNQYSRKSSIGGAFYMIPEFGKFSLPIRVEYIDQGGSEMYLDNPETKKIYAATISPTYRCTKASYIRLESSYVQATKGFADKDGEPKDDRIYLATEFGYLF